MSLITTQLFSLPPLPLSSPFSFLSVNSATVILAGFSRLPFPYASVAIAPAVTLIPPTRPASAVSAVDIKAAPTAALTGIDKAATSAPAKLPMMTSVPSYPTRAIAMVTMTDAARAARMTTAVIFKVFQSIFSWFVPKIDVRDEIWCKLRVFCDKSECAGGEMCLTKSGRREERCEVVQIALELIASSERDALGTGAISHLTVVQVLSCKIVKSELCRKFLKTTYFHSQRRVFFVGNEVHVYFEIASKYWLTK